MLPIGKWKPQAAIGPSPHRRHRSQFSTSMIDFLRHVQQFPN
jgi:hypothetical protein